MIKRHPEQGVGNTNDFGVHASQTNWCKALWNGNDSGKLDRVICLKEFEFHGRK